MKIIFHISKTRTRDHNNHKKHPKHKHKHSASHIILHVLALPDDDALTLTRYHPFIPFALQWEHSCIPIQKPKFPTLTNSKPQKPITLP
ncbi:hypothetical protein JHK82_044948 [Glycine max]|nr:hypothetical protein JHK82_044948 [Glycine max]KAH1151279.1 hypothetical protein GYH30_044989 [Glycine max]